MRTDRPLPHPNPKSVLWRISGVSGVAMIGAILLTSCVPDTPPDDGHAATSVTPTWTQKSVTGSPVDIGNIVIGWGKKYSPTEITTPAPSEVKARCYPGDQPQISIRAPHGWIISVNKNSRTVVVNNSEQHLNGYLEMSETMSEMDWSTPGHVDLAASLKAPDHWDSPYEEAQHMYISLHVDCT